MPTVESTFDVHTNHLILTVADVGPTPAAWGLRLGDVVSNYRASLDHLAWAVVMRGDRSQQLSEQEERSVYYPVIAPGSDASRAVKRNLPGATDADQAIVRRFQPDRLDVDGIPHCLTVLQEASNLDKHRSLQPMPLCVAQSTLTINSLEDCTLTSEGFTLVHTDPIRPGSEVGRISVRATGPRPRAYMNGRFGLKVTIDGKSWLLEWLTEIQAFIGQLLAEFSEPPTGVVYIPPDFLDSTP